jgi:hypothetical protein
MTFFRDLAPCCLIYTERRFGEAHCLHQLAKRLVTHMGRRERERKHSIKVAVKTNLWQRGERHIVSERGRGGASYC